MMPDKSRLWIDLRQPRAASVPDRGDLGAAGLATAGALLHAKIIAADKGLVVVVPGGAVVERQHAGQRDGEHRAFHIALLRIEIFRQPGTGVVHIIDAPHAGEVLDLSLIHISEPTRPY